MLQDYVELFWRRKWLVVISLVVGIAAGALLSSSLPPVYQSSTLMRVEPQKVPVSHVHPRVIGSVNDRLPTISQQILSRTNLAKIIKEYSLYNAEDGAPTTRDDLWGFVQDKTQQLLVKYGLSRERISAPLHQDDVPEEMINRMRQDIDVKVTGPEAFSVAFHGRHPHTVMRITQTLALLFLEEPLKARERQAEGISEFLENQLVEAEKELQRQERHLREYQQQYRGALPAQLDANLSTLDRLQQELNALNELIKNTEQTLAEARKAVEEQTGQQPETSAPASQAATPKPPALHLRLATLQQDLARLRITFNDNYPDIVSIKNQIAVLEAAPQSDSAVPSGEPVPGTSAQRTASPLIPKTNTLPSITSSVPATTKRSSPTRPVVFPRDGEKAERELATLRLRRGKIMAQSQQVEEYVNTTPANEAKLTELTRDYEMSLGNYQSLLSKRLQEKISENLEKK